MQCQNACLNHWANLVVMNKSHCFVILSKLKVKGDPDLHWEGKLSRPSDYDGGWLFQWSFYEDGVARTLCGPESILGSSDDDTH